MAASNHWPRVEGGERICLGILVLAARFIATVMIFGIQVWEKDISREKETEKSVSDFSVSLCPI
ncbi:MAG: hypothetical protein J5878_04995, partial [Oscillospiraceae bacterium]|nr:hypothetical protein [Oscillospiraceae bacterium]